MTLWDRFEKWIADAWNAGLRADVTPANERAHQAKTETLASRPPPAMTGNMREHLPKPPPVPREARMPPKRGQT